MEQIKSNNMFKLPAEVIGKIKDYGSALEDFLKEKINPARFTGIRVPWGIYSHRGRKSYMNRIRIPAGQLGPVQMKAVAHVSKTYGNGVVHVTTRQDLQVHNVKIDDTIKLIEYLKDYDLSPIGGGGNTVRNVSACSLAGVCPDEVFDVRPHALALTEYLLRQDNSFALPRKFKIAFSGCQKDCAGCLVNDVGFLAVEKDAKRGFKVYAGGGMGAVSRVGRLLEEFIPEDEMPYCAEAVKRIYYSKGERKNKHHNRLRFLIEDMGFEKFAVLYKTEFKNLKENEYITLRKIEFPQNTHVPAEPQKNNDKEYNEFLKYNVLAQKQAGFYCVELRIPQGDIAAKDLETLADLEKVFPCIEFKASAEQNLLILWVRHEDIYNLFLKLKNIFNDFLYPRTALDTVACKGALTCNLGLCNSPGLSKEIENIIKDNFIGKNIFKKLDIKLNGCPNSCGQHPIGKISFHGIAKRVNNRPVPFYKFFLGGIKELEKTRLAKEAGIIPARNVPSFLKEFLAKIEAVISGETDIDEFLAGAAVDMAKESLRNYAHVPSYSENKEFYMDWGSAEEFSLAGLGPGECGAGIIDMIESDLNDAKISLGNAEKNAFHPESIKKAVFLSARALLVVKGRDPKNENEALSDFKEKFIDDQIASNEYAAVKDNYENISDKIGIDERRMKFTYAKNFLEHINNLYNSMDSAFNFPKHEVKQKNSEAVPSFLDLKGVGCPINYVKVKIALEYLKQGDILEVLLDEGEPIDNVPRSLKSDGQDVLNIEKQNGHYKVTVRKIC